MEQKQKLRKSSQVINFPSEEIIQKLMAAPTLEDRLVGIELLLMKYEISSDRFREVECYLRNKITVVLRDTSTRQEELVIGKYGYIKRKITDICVPGVKILWI